MSVNITVIKDTGAYSLNDDELSEVLNGFSDVVPLSCRMDFRELYERETYTVKLRDDIERGLKYSPNVYYAVHGFRDFTSWWQNSNILPHVTDVEVVRREKKVDNSVIGAMEDNIGGATTVSQNLPDVMNVQPTVSKQTLSKQTLSKQTLSKQTLSKQTLSKPTVRLNTDFESLKLEYPIVVNYNGAIRIWNDSMKVNGLEIVLKTIPENYHAGPLVAIGSFNESVLNLSPDFNNSQHDKIYAVLLRYRKYATRSQYTLYAQPHVQTVDPFLLQLESIYHGRFYSDANWSIQELSHIVSAYKIHGADHPYVAELLSNYKYKQNRIEFEKKTLQLQNEYALKMTVMTVIIRNHYPRAYKSLLESMKNPGTRASEKLVRKVLKPAEYKQVELSYQSYLRQLNAIGNNCTHRKLLQQLRRAINSNVVAALLDQLGVSPTALKKRAMIPCGKCRADMICPHVVILLKARVAKKSSAEIRAQMYDFISPSMYCVVCGESMDTLEEMDVSEDIDVMSNRDAELLDSAWQEVARVVRSFTFGPYVNVKTLITQVRDAIYSHIYEIEKQIMKSKTASADEINSKMRIFTNIYAYAQMIHMTSNAITFGRAKTVPDMIRYAIELLLQSMQSPMKIVKMTSDVVKNGIITAYKSLQKIKSVKTEILDTDDFNIDPIMRAYAIYRSYTNGGSIMDNLDTLSEMIIKDKSTFAELPVKYKPSKNPLVVAIESIIKRDRSEDIPDAITIKPPVHSPYGFTYKLRDYTTISTPLSNVYDENGKPHRFDIFVVNADVVLEHTAKELAKLRDENRSFTIIDKRCSICQVKKSETHLLDDVKIQESLHNLSLIDGFYMFYTERCPVEGLHEWEQTGDSTNQCKKCSMIQGGTKNRDITFRKYKAKYLQDKRELSHYAEPGETAPILEPLPELAKWVPDFSVLNALSTELKINLNYLTSLGAFEGQELADVESGKFIPMDEEEIYNKRVYVLDSYVRTYFVEYAKVRVFYKDLKSYSALMTLLSQYKNNLSSLSAKLPDIYNDYSKRFYSARLLLKPSDVVKFCIEEIANITRKLLNDPVVETREIRTIFVNYILNKIIRAEILVTKPGNFNYTQVFGTDAISVTAEKENDDDADEAGTVADAEEENIMSMEAFDMEDDVNDDGEMSENGIRVEFNGID